MNEIQLKYGCNPNQKPSRIFMEDGSDLPVTVLNGKPGYINFLDAFNGWQLVKELKEATGLPAATSFKHVSPAGAAVGLPLSDTLAKIYWVDDLGELSPLACAYARARGADRMSSFGDFIALSDICDTDTARLIKREVSDGVIAPGYTDEALELLKQKKKGAYNIIQIDPSYQPAPIERKQVYGITFEQGRNELDINGDLLSNIVAIDGETKLKDAIASMLGGKNSRYPVYEENIDHIIGILHLKDAMRFHISDDKLDLPIAKLDGLLREPYFVPQTKNIDELFKEMQSQKLQMASFP